MGSGTVQFTSRDVAKRLTSSYNRGRGEAVAGVTPGTSEELKKSYLPGTMLCISRYERKWSDRLTFLQESTRQFNS